MKKNILGLMIGTLLLSANTVKASNTQNLFWALGAVTLGYVWYNHGDFLLKKPVIDQEHEDRLSNINQRLKKLKNKSDISLQSKAPTLDVHLEQLSVTQQGRNNDGGASCGYHSLKNAIGVLTNNRDILNNITFVKDQFSLSPGSWRKIIQQKQHDNGEWIETEHLDMLIGSEFKKRNINAGFSLINNRGQAINEAHVGTDMFAVLRTLQPKDTYRHAFFVNTGTGYTVGQRAHWFIVVMEKKINEPTMYKVMDSLGYDRTKDQTVWTIIQQVHGCKVAVPKASADKKASTKKLFFDTAQSCAGANGSQKEQLTQQLLELFSMLKQENLVDDTVNATLQSVLG